MSNIIHHPGPTNPFTGQTLGPAVTEYLLPLEMPDLLDLPAEFTDLARQKSDIAAASLQSANADIVDPAVARFAQRLERFVPLSLVHWQGGWLLRRALQGVEDYSAGNNFYCKPRPSDQEIAGFQRFAGSNALFLDFMKHFGGLAENLPPASGSFADESVSFADTPWSQQVEVPADWRDALCIYLALNGDVLLLGASGSVGWYFLGEGKIEKYTNSFAEFLDRYTRFNLEYRQAFDAYSATDPYLPREKT